MNQCNRGAGNHFRKANGEPRDEEANMRPADTQKRNIAIGHDAMAADVLHSITDWLLEAAVKGKQRHFYIENPTKSMLWDRPYMSDFLGLSGLTPQRCNYCRYRVMLADPLVYPTPKSTRILTNVSGWEPRQCPNLANHDAHTAAISGPNSEERPSFFGIPEETYVFMTPEELHLDIATAAMQK